MNDNELERLLQTLGNPIEMINLEFFADLVGSDRPNVFHITDTGDLAPIIERLKAARISTAIVAGIGQSGILACARLKQAGFRVTLIPGGGEPPELLEKLQQEQIRTMFNEQGFELFPHPPTAIRGSEVHCQSGYCGFVCKGRFIEESQEAGCVQTRKGKIYADSVFLVTAP